MSLREQRFQRALGLVAAGKGTLWAPSLTFTQEDRLPELMQSIARNKYSGANVIFWDDGFVDYRSLRDVDPDADAPAWVEELRGIVTHGVTGDIFSIDDDTLPEHLIYTYTSATIDSNKGTILKARVRVNSSSSGQYSGACLGIFDGVYQYILLLREDGISIFPGEDSPIDMTVWRHVTFVARTGGSEVWVDGNLRQIGSWANETAKKQVSFGSYIPAP